MSSPNQINIFRQRSVIAAGIPRIVREHDAEGWLVIDRSYGWLFGSRSDAVRELRKLTDEMR
jgi:hypothetical protein